MKFILEQIKGARYKLAEHRYVKADQQLSSIQLYCEEILDGKEPFSSDAVLGDVRAIENALKTYEWFLHGSERDSERKELYKAKRALKKISERFS